MSKALIFATLRRPPAADLLAAAGALADGLAVRGDLIPVSDLGNLRARFPGRLLYSLRSRAAGGAADLAVAERQRRLCAAAADYDLVELEAAHDLRPEILAAVPAAQRVISWYGPATPTASLMARFEHLAATPARFYRLMPTTDTIGEALAPLRLLQHLDRRDVIAYGAGAAGLWTRPLAARYGAPVIFGALEMEGATGEPTVQQLRHDYGCGQRVGDGGIGGITQLFGILGATVLSSLAPRIHNTVYRRAGLAALYVPWPAKHDDDFWSGLARGEALAELGLTLGGLTVVAPQKEQALSVATSCGAVARRAGAANLLIPNPAGGGWHADTTDPQGVLEPLAALGVKVRGAAVAVIGCGGAGRAVLCGLQAAGARVVLANRSIDRGRRIATTLGVPFVPLADLRPRDFVAVVNATPAAGEPRLTAHQLAPATVVVDMAYAASPVPTPTAAAARARGCRVIDGRAVLATEMRHQLRAMTGIDAPAPELERMLR